jgi:hypothetical protein
MMSNGGDAFAALEGFSAANEEVVEIPRRSLSSDQSKLAEVFELRTAAEMADMLASNDPLLDRILGT